MMTKPLLAILLLLPLSTPAWAEVESYRCKVIQKVGARYDGATDTVVQLSYRIDELDEYRVLNHEALVEKVGADKFRDWLLDERYPFEKGDYYVQPTYADPNFGLTWDYLRRFVDRFFISGGGTALSERYYFNAASLRLEVADRAGHWAYADTDQQLDSVSKFAQCAPYYD